jgi:antitoxin MazE
MAEAGLPGYEITSWQAMFAPARTPREIVLRLHAEVAKILKHPDLASRLADLGADPSGMTPEELSGIGLTGPGLWNNIVITMKAVHVTIRQIGNSHGIVIPKPVLAQVGLEGVAEMTIEAGALVLRKPAKPVRAGWAEAAKKIAEAGDDALVMGEFGNEADADLAW